jgi:hypothetical protein
MQNNTMHLHDVCGTEFTVHGILHMYMFRARRFIFRQKVVTSTGAVQYVCTRVMRYNMCLHV